MASFDLVLCESKRDGTRTAGNERTAKDKLEAVSGPVMSRYSIMSSLVALMEETEIRGTECGPDVSFACGEPQTPHADIWAKIVLHLPRGLRVERKEP